MQSNMQKIFGMEKERQRASGKTKSLWKRLLKKPFRDAFVASTLDDRLAAQIHALRNHRGWTQTDLAERSGMAQARISVLENSCSNVSLTSLKRIASAFDVALLVKFAPYSELVNESVTDQLDKNVASFGDDSPRPSRAYSYVFRPSGEGARALQLATTSTSQWSKARVKTGGRTAKVAEASYVQ